MTDQVELTKVCKSGEIPDLKSC